MDMIYNIVDSQVDSLYNCAQNIHAISLVYKLSTLFKDIESENNFIFTRGVPNKWKDSSWYKDFFEKIQVSSFMYNNNSYFHMRNFQYSGDGGNIEQIIGQISSDFSGDIIGFPLYGKLGNYAVCYLIFDKPIEENFEQDIISTYRMIQGIHYTIIDMICENMSDIIGLTRREISVLRLVALGKGNREIAIELNLSPSTVDTYLRRIFFKTETNDRTEASIRAISLGILRL